MAALGHEDQSGFEFVQEMLGGDSTAAINFDRFQYSETLGRYVIFEWLHCEERSDVNPYTSHPNRYWRKNRRKFTSLYTAANNYPADLYLVNYATKGTKDEDKVLLIKVIRLDEGGIRAEKKWQFTREGFKKWFQKMNADGLTTDEQCFERLYDSMDEEELGKTKCDKGSMADLFKSNPAYLKELAGTKKPFAMAAKCYLKKKGAL